MRKPDVAPRIMGERGRRGRVLRNQGGRQMRKPDVAPLSTGERGRRGRVLRNQGVSKGGAYVYILSSQHQSYDNYSCHNSTRGMAVRRTA